MTATHVGGRSALIGRGYKLASIANVSDEVWVCFATSKTNPEILRLSPATTERFISDAVRIESSDGEIRWMIPGVEVAIHSQDLASETAATGYEVCDAPSADERTIDQGLDGEQRERLTHVARQIEFHFHESDQPAIPSIEDCQLQAIEPEKSTALFHWKHDKRRTYRLTGHDGTWSLLQTYQDDNPMPYDAMVPLKIGDASFEFTTASEPGTSLPALQVATLIGKFGLEATFATSLNKSRNFENSKAGIQSILVRLVANLSPLRVAANFATTEAPRPLQQRTGQFQWNGEVVNLSARPDPAGRRVQVESWIDAPSRAYPTVRMTIKFPGIDLAATSFVLNGNGKLQGRVSIPLAWRDFSALTDMQVEMQVEPEIEV